METRRPNILLITDDQHRFDFFGDMETVPSLKTPNLDRLRQEGTTLTNAYSVCPICMPARFAWYYGLYPSQTAYRLMANAHDWPEPSRFRSAPGELQNAGYHTAVIGKVHSHAGLYANDITVKEWQTRQRGFDEAWEVSGKSLSYWFDCRWTHCLQDKGLLSKYRADLIRRNRQLGGEERYEPSVLPEDDAMDAFIGRRAMKWLNGYEGGKPFFLHISFCGPHFPLDPPESFFRRHNPEDMPIPAGGDDGEITRKWRELRASYCGLVELVDMQVGRILDSLDRRGWTDNTAVIFCSDHGDMLGDLGREQKSLWQDPSARTPITLRLPDDIPANKSLYGMVESVDLPLSMMDIAGLDGAGLVQSPGMSFWDYARGRKSGHRRWVYSECGNGSNEWRMVCDEEWKYVWHSSDGEMLFERNADPFDLENLIDSKSQTDQINLMRRSLINSLSRCVAPNTVPYFATGEL